MPGGRVLNPQSYHSAFRISSTRQEEARGIVNVYDTPYLGKQKNLIFDQENHSATFPP